MPFKWQSFLEANRIDYVTRGPNTAPGNISISCPLCSSDDPSHHMGLSLTTGFWGCWRNENHRGRSPVRLIQALLKCSRFKAEVLAGHNSFQPLDEFDKIIANLSAEVTETDENITKVVFPPDIKVLADKGMGTIFIDYLVSRDYTRDEAKHLCEVYWLMYATSGQFASRIIIPIEMPEGIATFTGRDITGTSESRYKTLSKDESRYSIKDTLFGFKSLIEDNDPNTLIVCEGPFDAIRLDFFGFQFGIRATCLFGLQASDRQVSLLARLDAVYKNKYLCLDAGAHVLQTHLLNKLSFLDFEPLYLPEGYKDPGELPKDVIKGWFQTIS